MSASRFSKMVPLLMHLILAHRAQSREGIRASRLFVLSTGLLSSCQGACSRDSTSHRDSPVRCCVLTACLFLAGKPCANAHAHLLSSSVPSGYPSEGKNGRQVHPLRGKKKVGYGAIFPCPVEWSELAGALFFFLFFFFWHNNGDNRFLVWVLGYLDTAWVPYPYLMPK